MEIKKEDWETILKENEKQRDQLIKNYKMSRPQIEAVIALCTEEIDKFLLSEVKDEIPKELKKVIKEVVK